MRIYKFDSNNNLGNFHIRSILLLYIDVLLVDINDLELVY